VREVIQRNALGVDRQFEQRPVSEISIEVSVGHPLDNLAVFGEH
jgi:hypothetical protein